MSRYEGVVHFYAFKSLKAFEDLTEQLKSMSIKIDTMNRNQIKLTTRFSATEEETKALQTNITKVFNALIESQAGDNIPRLSYGVLDAFYNLHFFKHYFPTVESDPQKFFEISFGARDIALWNMGGVYPPQKVYFTASIDKIQHLREF